MNSPSKILLAFDFSERGEKLLKYATSFAHKKKLDVEAIYVMEDSGPLAALFEGESLLALQKQIQSKFMQVCERLQVRLTPQLVVRSGKVYTEVSNYAHAQKEVLFVATSINSSPMGQGEQLVGSNVQRLVSLLKKPFLIASDLPRDKEQNEITVPVGQLDHAANLTFLEPWLRLFSDSTCCNLIEVHTHQDEFQINKNLIKLNTLRENLKEQGFQVFAELLKSGKGDESIDQIISKYAVRNDSGMVVFPYAQQGETKTLQPALVMDMLAHLPLPLLLLPY